MKIRSLILGAMAASCLGALTVPAPALADVDVYLNFGPPAVRYERVPVIREGYVWAPGYWDWRGNRHVWVRGHWVRERPGYVYYPSEWVYSDGRWRLKRERWTAGEIHAGRGDRDRDGVPNQFDRDRDGDGVPNYRDAKPNNPRRN